MKKKILSITLTVCVAVVFSMTSVFSEVGFSEIPSLLTQKEDMPSEATLQEDIEDTLPLEGEYPEGTTEGAESLVEAMDVSVAALDTDTDYEDLLEKYFEVRASDFKKDHLGYDEIALNISDTVRDDLQKRRELVEKMPSNMNIDIQGGYSSWYVDSIDSSSSSQDIINVKEITYFDYYDLDLDPNQQQTASFETSHVMVIDKSNGSAVISEDRYTEEECNGMISTNYEDEYGGDTTESNAPAIEFSSDAGISTPNGYPNTYKNTGYQRNDIVGVAKTQIGYVEGRNNDNKYGVWYGMNYQPWCAIFVTWCARQAGVDGNIIKSSAVARATSPYFNISDERSGANYVPKPGDIFLVGHDRNMHTHTGIVWYVSGSYFYTVEGNCSDKVQSTKRAISSCNFAIPGYKEPIPPGPVTVKASASKLNAGQNITVNWSANPATKYWIGVYKNGNTSANLVENYWTTNKSFTKSYGAGNYIVVVAARNGNSTVETKSSVSFTVNAVPVPDAPMIATSNNYYHTGDSISLSWAKVANATSYKYYISRYPHGYAYQTNQKTGTVSGTSLTVNDLPSGWYSCFVHAVNSEGKSSPKSNVLYFNIHDKEYVKSASTTYNGHIYVLYDNQSSWYFSKMLCEQMGGHLATVTSQGEENAIEALIENGAGNSYWLGGTCRSDFSSDGSYVWVTGEKFSYSNWNTSEPNKTVYDNQPGKTELYLEIRKSYGKKWNDCINQNQFGFVLEIEADSIQPAASITFGRSQYEVYDTNLTWEEAEVYCENNGGHLATIASKEENDAIGELLSKGARSKYYVGASTKSGNWKWTDGSAVKTSSSETGYSNWDSADPSNVSTSAWGATHYLMMYKNAGTHGIKNSWKAIDNLFWPTSEVSSIGFVLEKDNAVPAEPGKVTSQPQDQTVNAGETASFKVETTKFDTSDLNNQWKYSLDNGSTWKTIDITNAGEKKTENSSELKVPVSSALNGSQFRFEFRDEAGDMIYSNVAKLTVNPEDKPDPVDPDDPVVTDGTIVSAGKISSSAGSTVVVPVSITNNPGFAGFTLVVKTGDGLVLEDITSGSLLNGNLSSKNIKKGLVNYSTTENITGDGEILKLTISMDKDLSEGSYPIRIELKDNDEANFINEEGDPVKLSFNKGLVDISNYKLGDVNADDKVNTIDSLKLSQYLVDMVEFTSIQKRAADVNVDGKVTSSDAVKLARFLVGLVDSLSEEESGAGAVSLESIEISIDPATITEINDEKYLDVPVSILDNKGFAGFSFTADYDSSKLELLDFIAGDILNGDLKYNGDQVTYTGPENIEEDGDLFIMHFRVLDDAEIAEYGIDVGLTDGESSNFVDEFGNEISFLKNNLLDGSTSPVLVSAGCDGNNVTYEMNAALRTLGGNKKVVAVFYKDGQMVDSKTEPAVLAPGEQSFEVSVSDYDTCHVYVVNENSYQPISEPIIIEK